MSESDPSTPPQRDRSAIARLLDRHVIVDPATLDPATAAHLDRLLADEDREIAELEARERLGQKSTQPPS